MHVRFDKSLATEPHHYRLLRYVRLTVDRRIVKRVLLIRDSHLSTRHPVDIFVTSHVYSTRLKMGTVSCFAGKDLRRRIAYWIEQRMTKGAYEDIRYIKRQSSWRTTLQ